MRIKTEILYLDDVSLRVNKGDLIAIVGESGIGKSTMMKLMLHLMPCESGKLYFETVNGKIEIDAGTRNVFSYVPQGEYDHVGNNSGEHYLL